MKTECEHENFMTEACIVRLTDTDGSPVTGYRVDIKIHCTDCDRPFAFIGCMRGYNLAGPAMNIDGTELTIPIEPAKPLHEILGHATQ